MPSLLARAALQWDQHKLTRDIAYTLGSFVVLAASGVVINVTVTALRDASALGVFNLAYAVYILLSQLAAWGLHYSTLRHAAYYEDDRRERSGMLTTAGMLALLFGGVAAVLAVWLAPVLGVWFDSPRSGSAIAYAAFGLVFFPLNKVLLAYLNGLRRMKAFSVLQILRYVTVMLAVAAVAASPLPIEMATLAFLLAEVLTLLGALCYVAQRQLAGFVPARRVWIRRHLQFGTRGLLSGLFAEMNSRVDVILVGLFLDERATGIYSFAAMLIDGLYHVLAMVRINFNPVLVKAIKCQDWGQIRGLRRQSGHWVPRGMAGLSVAVLAGFVLFAEALLPGKGLMEGLPALLILLAGLNLVAVLVPFDNIMMVSGHPGYQTTQQMVMVGVNIAVALLAMPILGIEGAAIGTAASYLASVATLIFFTNKLLGWNLVINRASSRH